MAVMKVNAAFLTGQAGELLNGFVECLEVEEPEELDPDTQGTIR